MEKFKKLMCYLVVLVVGICVLLLLLGSTIDKTPQHQYVESNWQPETSSTPKPPSMTVTYTPMGVPNINSSFKTWMDYNCTTDKNSNQYKFIHRWGWSDYEGFMRCNGERDLGIGDDYYLIALGSYYGTTIGTKYRITLDTGRVFYGVLAECKADIHTNATNQYIPKNQNIVEFLIDETKLNMLVKDRGNANVYMPLNGKVVSIEKMDFVKN